MCKKYPSFYIFKLKNYKFKNKIKSIQIIYNLLPSTPTSLIHIGGYNRSNF